jgi:hypothetical protein
LPSEIPILGHEAHPGLGFKKLTNFTERGTGMVIAELKL